MLRIDLLGFGEEDFKPGDLFAQINLRPVSGLLSKGGQMRKKAPRPQFLVERNQNFQQQLRFKVNKVF